MPVAKVVGLYRIFSGKEFVSVEASSEPLDVTASRTEDKIYLHVVNTSRVRSTTVQFQVDEMSIRSGKAHELSAPPEFEIMRAENDPLMPKTKEIDVRSPYTIPPASVTAIELICSR
jgi:hypothetical protein